MRRLSLLLLATLAAGCATTPAPVEPGRAADPALLSAWTAKGRVAVAVAGKGGSGTFLWTQRESATQLEIRGPLGVGALRIETDGQSLRVQDGESQPIDAEAAREALQVRLGADLPLAQMRYWILGIAAPGSDARVTTGDHGSRQIEQAGWSVAYEPHAVVQGWSVPTRLTATRAPMRIKVLVDDWQLPPVPGVTP